jgi:hypothetical protein
MSAFAVQVGHQGGGVAGAAELDMDCETMLTPEHDQRLLLFRARPGTASHERLQLLRVIGLQDFGGPDRLSGGPVAADASDHA